MTRFLKKVEKPDFRPFWALWAQIWAKRDFSRKKIFRRMIEDHEILHFEVIPAETNDSISRKS